ncbi:MAG: bacteriohopanetetrol glucosamine biosynthesis glycosyltransferase HpnI [Acidithiobacillus sp.]|nr:bacteriohopanetetrol glucosamine biosynthesis glycosyltransferase HpnI [Acidithiobacillus sp.]
MTMLVWILTIIALASLGYWVLAWWQLERFRPILPETPAPKECRDCPPAALLKPCHGVEEGLLANLQSFLAQNYPSYEVLCGVQDPADPALPLLQSLVATAGNRLRVILHQTPLGLNPKVANLQGILAASQYDFLVLSDADIRVGPGYLATLWGELQQEGVGVVTCLYRARVEGGGWSAVLGAQIQEQFLPSVLLAARWGPQIYCAGATIALERTLLEKIGGFPAIADALADDFALGAAARELGYRVALSAVVVETVVREENFRAFYSHALRWARTTRAVQPWGHAFSFLAWPLPWLCLASLAWGEPLGVLLVLILRLVYHERIVRKLRSPIPLWAAFLGDCMGLILWGHARITGKVHWRGRNFVVHAGGQMDNGVKP